MTAVKIEHRVYRNDGLPHIVTVRDMRDKSILFTDTLKGVAAWLETFGFIWSGINGVWVADQ